MFVGRKKELKKFHNFYYRKSFQIHAIIGNRNSGKTQFIKEIINGKKCIYFCAHNLSTNELLNHFTQTLFEQYPDYRLSYGEPFKTWTELFNYLAELTLNRKMIIVFDNFDLILNSNSEFLLTIKNIIEEKLLNTQMCLVFLGTKFIDQLESNKKLKIIEYITSIIQLDNLTYNESSLFLTNWTKTDKLYAYGVSGGNPYYLSRLSLYDNFREAIIYELIDDKGLLRNEINNIVKEYVREPGIYNSIIRAISKDSFRQNEIALKINKNTNDVAVYLKKLVDIKIIKKEYPFDSDSYKNVIYRVTDSLLDFWYRFVFDYIELAVIGSAEKIFDKYIESKLSEYYEQYFIEVCDQFLNDEIESDNFIEKYNHHSVWWDYDNPSKRYIIYSNRKSILIAACHFNGSLSNQQEIDELIKVGKKISKGKSIQYILVTNESYEEETIDNLLIYDFQ